ncbi:MAG: site-specific integrase [Geminicoccaceae bacterium]
MAGKQAKLLSERDLGIALRHTACGRHPQRDRLILLLSAKAGLRAGEIAKLTWPMLLDATGRVAITLELHDRAAKKGSGRTILLHPELRALLLRVRRQADRFGPVIVSERGGAMRPASIVNWFRHLYRELGFDGCSSHSGRRTFITNAARQVHRAGGSLRDVQELAGHRSLSMTQSYIVGDTAAKRRLVGLL